MDQAERGSGAVWLIIALGVTLVCCLCLLIVGAAASLIVIQRSEGQPYSTAISPTLEPAITAVVPPDDTSLIPEESFQSLETLAETLVPIADPIGLSQRLAGLGELERVLAIEAAPVELGTVKTFWASNVDENSNFQLDAELRYATEHVYFWVEEGVDARQADIEALVDEFESDIYVTNRSFFGSEWSPGVDGDEHLYLLFARGLGFNIAGYFASNDSYPPAVHEFSNGHEMFYLSADNLDLRDEFTYGVLAHEFQHMIHWNLDRNEETWMNEGFSEVASLLNNYDVGGFDFAYARSPDQTLTYWPSEPGTAGGHYGQSFLFLSYFLQRFGSEATQALVANIENGLDSIDEALVQIGEVNPETGAVFNDDDVYLDWAVAMLLQEPSLTEDERYGYTIYDSAPRASLSDEFDECPLDQLDRTVFPYGVDYVRFQCDEPQQIIFDGASLIQVVPADAHSGDYAFWSNRGDESDMLLTRQFDLSGVEGSAEFSYWTWYQIEEGWDYLYLEISTDDGETWQIMETPSGTDDDPSGNSYGWGYTANSGGGERGEWIQEVVDLSDFAGQKIQLRFEYVTDAAVNGEGLLLDDLSLEAVGYQEDFEADDGGWESAGWVRLYNRIPQSYRLALVEQGRETSITEIELDTNHRAQFMVDFGGSVDEAILVIVNTARHTWQAAPYTFGTGR